MGPVRHLVVNCRDILPGWLLNLVYALVVLLCSPILLWRSLRLGKYRTGWSEKFLGHVPLYPKEKSSTPRIWLHAVSVGEVLQLRQVLVQLRSVLPEAEVIVSTTTRTGHDVAREKLQGVHVVYFPLDFTWAVKSALRRLQPDVFVLVELELWPNFLRSSIRQNVTLGLINGRLSERSYKGYRRLRWLLRPLLSRFSFLAIQSDEYRDRFVAIGARAETCHVTGSIKFDGLQTSRDLPLTEELRVQFGIEPTDRVFIAGSTQEPEEQIALQVYRELQPAYPQLRLILVPRHPERATAIARMVEEAGFSLQRRSQHGPPPQSGARPVGMLDTVGELSACWGLADIAFVGGSFGNRGGQNMMEPAAYGAAVCFGPNTRNFRQIVELLTQADAVQVVQDPAALKAFVEKMLQYPDEGAELGRRAQQLVLSQQGATQRTIDLLRASFSA
ncbi:MAG: 3-deoxy-D-manno-octulosonic acid transferase [Planctomycetaceae bacterium]|nr:3-deoxy-D-manno-octulosonic acid transferase [Planctomycetaceae bacterium]